MADGIAARISDLKRRLAALDDECGDGGPEADAALDRIERRIGVRFPGDYRAFMSAIGRLPSLVPHYGMVPPGFAPGHGLDAPKPADLAKPFPFVDVWLWEDEPVPPPQPGWPADVPLAREMVDHGVLPLGTDGCGMVPMLVVTGAKRGEIWLFTDVGIGPDTMHGSGARPSSAFFLDWLQARIEAFAADENKFRNPPGCPDPWWTYVS